jgi:hypothetical protein
VNIKCGGLCRSRGVVGVWDRKEVEERRRKVVQANEIENSNNSRTGEGKIDQTQSEGTDADFVVNELPFMNNSGAEAGERKFYLDARHKAARVDEEISTELSDTYHTFTAFFDKLKVSDFNERTELISAHTLKQFFFGGWR